MNNVLNDLFDYNLKIYQNTDAFKFSIDSILLAEFVEVDKRAEQILDLCTGNGVIPLVLSTKLKAKLYGVEIQQDIFDLAVKSIEINKLENQIQVINDSVLNIKKHFIAEFFDIVTSNPPYFKYFETSIKNQSDSKAIARHEIEIDLDSLIKETGYLLKNKGVFYLVHRPERLEEIILILNKYKFVVKKVQFVYSNINKNAIIVLVKAVKNGNFGLKVLKPLDISRLSTYKNMVGD